MLKRTLCLTLLGVGLLLGPAGADDIYLRNQKFKGPVKGTGRATEVGLNAFAEIMGLKVTEQEGALFVHPREVTGTDFGVSGDPGGVYVVGRRVQSEVEADGTVMISLWEAADAAGFVVRPNAALHTIDIYMKPVPRIPVVMDDTPAVAASTSSGKSKSTGKPRKGVIPGQEDPSVRAFESMPPRQINQPGAAVDLKANLVAGRPNLIVFGANW